MTHPEFTRRFVDRHHHIPKLKLLEVFPLLPFMQNTSGYTVVDVGANLGLWTESFLDVFAPTVSRQIMYEPLPGNATQLHRHVEGPLSRLVLPMLVEEKAIGDRIGDAELFHENQVSTLASVENTHSDLGSDRVDLPFRTRVAMTTLDAEMDRLNCERIHLLKIDAEGAELNVLKGAKSAISSGKIDNIYFELGPAQRNSGIKLKHFFELLSRHGYRFFKIPV